MTNPTDPKQNRTKRFAKSLLNRHFGASIEFFENFRSDISAASSALKTRQLSEYAVHPDEDEKKWNQKKWFFLVEIQIYQLGFVASILHSVATQSLSLISLLLSIWCVGWYVARIRDTYRARFISAHWHRRSSPLSLTWSRFAEKVKDKPVILIPLWRVF